MTNPTLETIESELKAMNINLAEANDIATLSAYSTIPPTLDDESRRALGRLRDRVMERAKARTAG